jgi:nitroreductase
VPRPIARWTSRSPTAEWERGQGSAVADQDQARRVLGLPEDRYLAYLMDLGYPADRPLRPIRTPNRRPFDEVVHRGRW